MASIRKIQNKKGISYKIEVSLGYDINGKKIRETTTFTPDPKMSKYRQEKALQQFAMEFEEKAKHGKCIRGDKTTLEKFVQEWLKTYGEIQLEETSLYRYKAVLNINILPALGHMKIGKIKPYDIERFYASLTKDGARHDGKPGGYSHESIKKIKTILSSVLSTAEQWEVIEANPCRKANMPKQSEIQEKLKVYTLEQTRRFLQFVEEDYRKSKERHPDIGPAGSITDCSAKEILKMQYRIFFPLAVFGGLRRGEMVGLEWKNIDFEKNVIHIRQSVSRLGKKDIIKAPKSRCSIRSVAFPPLIMRLMKEYQEEQQKYSHSLGSRWHGQDWVFIQEDGRIMNVNTPYNKFHQLLQKYNKTVSVEMQLPILPLHCLRHTNASLLIKSNKVDTMSISKKLGHANMATTTKYYLHSYEIGERETADILGALLLSSS